MQLSGGEIEMTVVIRGCGEDPELFSVCWGKTVTPGALFPHADQTELRHQTIGMEGVQPYY